MLAKNYLSCFFSLILLIYTFPCSGLDINTALVKAYKNNPQFKIYQQHFLTQIEAFPQALSGFIPHIQASISSRYKTEKQTYPKISHTEEIGYRPIGDGMAIPYFKKVPYNKSRYNTLQKNIAIEQNIFNSGRDMALLKAAQATFRAARGEFYNNEQKVLSKCITAYLEYFESVELLKLSESSVQFFQKQFEAENEKLKLGESTKIDIAQARTELSKAEFSRAQSFAEMQSKKAVFKSIFGTKPDNIILPSLPQNLPSSQEQLLKAALANNFSLDTAKNSMISANSQSLAAKANLLPNVTAQILRASITNLSGSNKVRNHSVDSVISLNIPILSRGGAEYSKMRKAKNEARKLTSDYENSLNILRAEVISVWEKYNSTKQQIALAEEAIKSATIALEGTQEEKDLGTKTMLDVLTAKHKLYEVQTKKIKANTQYLLAAYTMKQIIGQLTAKALNLKVNYFSPEQEFKKIKFKVIGF